MMVSDALTPTAARLLDAIIPRAWRRRGGDMGGVVILVFTTLAMVSTCPQP